MMKTILSFMVMAMCCTQLQLLAQPGRVDYERLNLKGQVQWIEEKSFIALDSAGIVVKGEPGRARYSDTDQELEFNKSGMIVTETKSYTGGRFVSRQHYQYDEYLNQTRMEEFPADSILRLMVDSNIYENGKLVKAYRYQQSTIYDPEVVPYDIARICHYDSVGRLVHDFMYLDSVTLYAHYVFEYNENGQRAKTFWYATEDSLYGRYEYFYDETGNVTGYHWYHPEKLARKRTFTYDKHGNPITFTLQDFEEDETVKMRYVYTYDEIGNWTRQVQYKNGKLVFLVERKIRYFE